MKNVKQRIRFARTRCNFGGERIWFVCPSCARRCAVIYSCGKYFVCRICGNIAYSTQNETWQDRLFTKANKLREKIGAEPGAASPLPIFKPKGMHQRTWDRISVNCVSLFRSDEKALAEKLVSTVQPGTEWLVTGEPLILIHLGITVIQAHFYQAVKPFVEGDTP